MYSIIKYNLPKIDSFTLLIPINSVDVVSSTFLQKFSKLYETGEIEENTKEFYNNYEKTENLDSKTFLKYKRIYRLWNGERIEFLQIMVTSKLLKENYFDGINTLNFETIYNYINTDGVITITKENLLNSFVTDIDICKDFKVNIDGFRTLKRMMLENVLPEKESLLNSKKVNSKDDVFGIQYNERHKATPTRPFMKLYFKSIELKSEKTLPFTEVNLKDYETEINYGIARVEVTLKNSKHKERVGIKEVKTLKELLGLSSAKLENVYNSILSEYYAEREPLKQTKERMTPTDLIITNLLEFALRCNKELSTEEIVFITTKGAYDTKQKSIIKAKTIEVLQGLRAYKEIKKNDSEKSIPIEIMKNLGIFKDLE